MIDIAVIKDFGFPIFCVLALGYFCWQQFSRMTKKIDEMEMYMRNELAELTKQAHVREREFVTVLRDMPIDCPYKKHRAENETRDFGSTEVLMAGVNARHGQESSGKNPAHGSRSKSRQSGEH